MNYYIDDSKIELKDLQKRIEKTDLVPSRKSILENIDDIFKTLNKKGIKTLADLRNQVKTPKKLNEFSVKSGIDNDYLILLRREVESYFPKAFSINEFTWLPREECEKLNLLGLNNTKKIFEALNRKDNLRKLGIENNISNSFLNKILSLVTLTRIQWVSPLFAYMLYEVGYISPKNIAEANAEELCNAVNKINDSGEYFKGKIGLRDIKRLINSANYVC